MKTALDSNIISALWSNESSAIAISEALQRARGAGALVICGPVYVELAAHPTVPHKLLDTFLEETGIAVEFILEERVWKRAAVGFANYAQRRRISGGTSPKRLLADFLIAAHATICSDRLFTLDPVRYQQDFPELRLL
jgi:predicted nucleic acid-binding protein